MTEWRGAEAEIAALRGPLSRERVVELRALLRRAVAHGAERERARCAALVRAHRPTRDEVVVYGPGLGCRMTLLRVADAIERDEVDA